MTWDDYFKGLLALTLWREARGEGGNDLLAKRQALEGVAWVVRNRVKAGWGGWGSVLTRKFQFSSLTAPGDSQLIRWPAIPDASFVLCMEIANHVYDCPTRPWRDIGLDPTGGALYYYNPQTATSSWFTENVVKKLKKTVTIGNHEFFG